MDITSWEQYLVGNIANISTSIILIIASFLIARHLRAKLLHAFSKSKKNKAIKLFITNALYSIMLLIAAIMVLGKLGVPTTSLITLLGTSSLAIGLALKDFLTNIAAGIILIFQRPFEIGDVVDCSQTLGIVHKIDLFNVEIKTPNNEIVIIPNGKLIKEKIINKAYHGIRRQELLVQISYSSPLKKAKKIIEDIIANEPLALNEPKPQVAVNNLADNGVELTIRTWVLKDDFNNLKFSLLENIKLAFDEHNIEIPYNQIDITLKQPLDIGYTPEHKTAIPA